MQLFYWAAECGLAAQPPRMLSILFLERRHKKIFKSFYQESICQGGFHPKDEIPR
jgi:hypothetical protein